MRRSLRYSEGRRPAEVPRDISSRGFASQARFPGLLQPLDDEEVRQQPRVAVGVPLCVRRDEDVRDPLDARRIGRKQVLPDLALARLEVDLA